MSEHRLQLTGGDTEYTGELTFADAPDGLLTFEDGVASVEAETVAAGLEERYPNLDRLTEAAGDDDPPADPGDMTITELEEHLADTDYTDDELRRLKTAEEEGEGRVGALDAIDNALGAAD